MSRTSKSNIELNRQVAVNRQLSVLIEDQMHMGAVVIQPLVDKMYLGAMGISHTVRTLLDEGVVSDRRGVWVVLKKGKVVSVSLYKTKGAEYHVLQAL